MAKRRRHFANTNFRWPREAAPLSWRTAVNTTSSRDEAPTTPALPIRASVGFTPMPVSIRILPRGEPLAYPMKPLHHKEVRAEQDPCNFNTDYINAVKTDEARRQERTWLAQSHVLSGTCTDDDTGFAAAHTKDRTTLVRQAVLVGHGAHIGNCICYP